MDVVTANAGLFGLMYQHLPLDLVLDLFESVNAWEMKNTVADRLSRNAESVEEIIKGVPALAGNAAGISAEWAGFRIAGQAHLYGLMAAIERGEPWGVSVEVRGGEHLEEARTRGGGVVVVVPHLGFFQAIPLLLASYGMRPMVFANATGFADMESVCRATAPTLSDQVDVRFVQEGDTLGAAMTTLREGRPLVLYPEFSLGLSGNRSRLRAPFLGREVWVPTGPARLARAAGADLLQLTIRPTGPRRITIEVAPPIRHERIQSEAGAVALDVFSWFEQAILETPHLWWCWPMLASVMDVAGD
ncbi:LpxL/LpxP family acyltransferase [Nonomuraea sp. NPDC004297]